MGVCRKIINYETKLIPRTDIEVGRWIVREEGDCSVGIRALWGRFDALLRGSPQTSATKTLDDIESRVGRGTHRW